MKNNLEKTESITVIDTTEITIRTDFSCVFIAINDQIASRTIALTLEKGKELVEDLQKAIAEIEEDKRMSKRADF